MYPNFHPAEIGFTLYHHKINEEFDGDAVFSLWAAFHFRVTILFLKR